MRTVILLLALVPAVLGCDPDASTRLSNIPVCAIGQRRECNRPDGQRGEQVCSADGYWSSPCDPRDASADGGDASRDADDTLADAGGSVMDADTDSGR